MRQREEDMNANELADDMENGRFNDINYNKKKAADFVRQQQEQINNLKQWEKRQLDVIESLKLQLHTTLTNRNLEKPAVEDVMEKYCTCYKLGYSPLNDYASVKAK